MTEEQISRRRLNDASLSAVSKVSVTMTVVTTQSVEVTTQNLSDKKDFLGKVLVSFATLADPSLEQKLQDVQVGSINKPCRHIALRYLHSFITIPLGHWISSEDSY